MNIQFISTTQLQKNSKQVLDKEPIQIVLTNNKISGALLSAEFTKRLLESGVLDQLREEMWELNDKETARVIGRFREVQKSDLTLSRFRKEYGV